MNYIELQKSKILVVKHMNYIELRKSKILVVKHMNYIELQRSKILIGKNKIFNIAPEERNINYYLKWRIHIHR